MPVISKSKTGEFLQVLQNILQDWMRSPLKSLGCGQGPEDITLQSPPNGSLERQRETKILTKAVTAQWESSGVSESRPKHCDQINCLAY